MASPLHITGCCTHARRSVRKLTPAGHARNPRYVLRPLRACRVASWVQLATLEDQSMCGQGFALAARAEARRFALSVGGHPRPPGQSAAAGSCRWRVTPCPPRLPGLPSAPAKRGLPEQPKTNSRTRLPMRCKPPESPCTARDSVLKAQRVKAKPCGRAARGLDPATTWARPRPRTASS